MPSCIGSSWSESTTTSFGPCFPVGFKICKDLLVVWIGTSGLASVLAIKFSSEDFKLLCIFLRLVGSPLGPLSMQRLFFIRIPASLTTLWATMTALLARVSVRLTAVGVASILGIRSMIADDVSFLMPSPSRLRKFLKTRFPVTLLTVTEEEHIWLTVWCRNW